jgi:PGF-CTERM protein
MLQRMDRLSGVRWTVVLVIAALCVVSFAGLAVAAQDRFEPNDDRESAAPIEPGTYENLSFEPGGLDYYAVELEEGEELTATIQFDHDENDLDMRLFPPGEDSRMVAESATYDDQEQVSHTAEEAGTFYVAIWEYNGGSGTYDMEIEIAGGNGDGGGDDGTQESTTDGDDASGENGSGGDGSGDDGGSGSDDGLPGFGVVVALLGLIGAIALAGRKSRN